MRLVNVLKITSLFIVTVAITSYGGTVSVADNFGDNTLDAGIWDYQAEPGAAL